MCKCGMLVIRQISFTYTSHVVDVRLKTSLCSNLCHTNVSITPLPKLPINVRNLLSSLNSNCRVCKLPTNLGNVAVIRGPWITSPFRPSLESILLKWKGPAYARVCSPTSAQSVTDWFACAGRVNACGRRSGSVDVNTADI